MGDSRKALDSHCGLVARIDDFTPVLLSLTLCWYDTWHAFIDANSRLFWIALSLICLDAESQKLENPYHCCPL